MKDYGILGCGFAGKNADAELFMSYVVDPSERTKIMIDLHGGIDLDDIKSYKTIDACCHIFTKCVFFGFKFDNFLIACEDLKSLDKWFMSTHLVYVNTFHGLCLGWKHKRRLEHNMPA